MNTCTTIANLMKIKDVTEEDAKLIRAIWRSTNRTNLSKLHPLVAKVEWAYPNTLFRCVKRLCIDRILRTHGVEYLGLHKRKGVDVYYCNAGYTYAPTVIFIGGYLTVNCWGDYIERKLVAERQF